MSVTFGFLLGEQVDDLDFYTSYALLHKARSYVEHSISLMSLGSVTKTKCGFHVPTEPRSAWPANCDALIVPGAGDFRALGEAYETRQLIARHVENERPIYAICSGLTLLAKLGVGEGKRVSTHQLKGESLRRWYQLSSGAITKDGWLITIGGDGSNRYLKGAECFYCVARDFFPYAQVALERRVELCSQIAGQS